MGSSSNHSTADTFLFGALAMFVLCVIGLVINGILQAPRASALITLFIVGGVGACYGIGWATLFILDHGDYIFNPIQSYLVEKAEQERRRTYDGYLPDTGNPVVNALMRLELKYGFSSMGFVLSVSENRVPEHIDNLDQLEWMSLINKLPDLIATVTEEEKEALLKTVEAELAND